jgi:hypothetical protein
MNKIKSLASQVPRINDFYNVGPVQRAALEEFAELVVQECLRECDHVSAQHKKHRAFTLDFNEKNILAQGETAAVMIKNAIATKFEIMAAPQTIESVEWIEP